MLGLMKVAGLSAALSAGVVVAVPLTQPYTQSGKLFTERLGEAETSAQMIGTGARLVAVPGVTDALKGDRLGGLDRRQPGTVAVERRERTGDVDPGAPALKLNRRPER